MSDYIIGGWTQKLSATPPPTFSYTMYGMVTNLSGLTTGTAASPGWNPGTTTPPSIPAGKVLWTYGGGLCSPEAMPANSADVDAIVSATESRGWDGVDFDDECQMNTDNISSAMQRLEQKSYTFLAGWDYNNPNASSHGQQINDAVAGIAGAEVCDRFILMCYATAMWSEADIEANVGPAIERTIEHVGDRKNVILALTHAGLNEENLAIFLDNVTNHQIGGLFIWEFPSLAPQYLAEIEQRLGI